MSNRAVVVVPVFGRADMVRDCLQAALPDVIDSESCLIAIDDASPEPSMSDVLESLRDQAPGRVQIIRNEVNMGFVKTANLGMKLYPESDVVLLNSDVLVGGGWLSRLREDAYSDRRIGTVTPLSNNTTISSFPNFLRDNPLPFGLGLGDIGMAFKEPVLDVVDAPTGIGFCMYLKRAVLEEVGYFDEDSFGKGYGEENDLCQRAAKRGWRNVLTPNCFVWHLGGASFGAERNALIQRASLIMSRLHRNYHADVARFIQADPLREARLVRWFNLAAASGVPCVIHVTHALGGGVRRHVEELVELIGERAATLTLLPGTNNAVRLIVGPVPGAMEILLSGEADINSLLEVLADLNIACVHYHHLLGVPEKLVELARTLNAKSILTVHDYFLVSGNPTLVPGDDGTPRRSVSAAAERGRAAANPQFQVHWQGRWRHFVEGQDLVVFPSLAARAAFSTTYRVKSDVVAYHDDRARRAVLPRAFSGTRTVTFGVLGALSRDKGADLLEEIAKVGKRQRAPAVFVLVGYAYRVLKRVRATGPYDEEDIQNLVGLAAVDIIFFPAQWPETYSYTLSHALASGLPIAAPDIGAFPERLSGRPHVLVFDHRLDAESLLKELLDFADRLRRGEECLAPAAEEGALRDFYPAGYLADIGASRRLEGSLLTARGLSALRALARNGVPKRTNGRQLRERVLAVLWRVYMSPSAQWAFGWIPFRWKRALKRGLSRAPIHDLVGRPKH